MAGPWSIFVRFYFIAEQLMVDAVLRSPTFHRGVRHIHKKVHEAQHGRNPHEPLYPGEATEEPGRASSGFFKHFTDELRNQFKGTPTNPSPPPPRNGAPKK